MALRLSVVADLVRPRGVLAIDRFGLDGDLESVGIWFFVFAAREREACVGVVTAVRMVDCERAMVGVDGMALLSPRETGRADDVSSETCFRARLAGAVFSNRSEVLVFSTAC